MQNENTTSQIASLHKKALPYSAASQFGEQFLKKMYTKLLSDSKNYLFDFIDGGELLGFLCLTTDKESAVSNTFIVKSIFFTPSCYRAFLHPARLCKAIFDAFQVSHLVKRASGNQSVGYIISWATHAAAKQEVGMKLMIKCLQTMKSNSTIDWFVDVRHENKQVIDFYMNLGFKISAQTNLSAVLRYEK